MMMSVSAAAARCRTKKKLWMSDLEVKADNMAATNDALQAEVIKLRHELATLKSMMLAHRDCPVTRRQHKRYLTGITMYTSR